MSEPEQEPDEQPEPTEEPLQGDELAPDEEEAEDEPDAQPEPVEQPEPDEPTGLTEKQLDETRKKLDRENERHRARISDLIGDEAVLLEPCPLCTGFADGYRFPVEPPPDVIEATRVAIGLPDLSNFQQSTTTRECPSCVGLGVVLSGSKVPENAAITCVACNGSGYVVLNATGEITGPTALSNGSPSQELPAGVNPDDPAVKELRARGFTVFPPVQIGAG
jgi:hypothetical protein